MQLVILLQVSHNTVTILLSQPTKWTILGLLKNLKSTTLKKMKFSHKFTSETLKFNLFRKHQQHKWIKMIFSILQRKLTPFLELMLTKKKNNFVSRNTKIVSFLLSPTIVLNAFYGIFQVNSTWEDGKLANLGKVKNMEKDLK